MAKRISLRQFQQGLVERLSSAQRGEATRALLGIQAGPEYWLIELPDTGEIVPLKGLTTVPLTHSWFRGLANIRGSLFTIVDFSAFEGFEPTPITPDSRLLMANSRFGYSSALLVNRTLGLRNLEHLEKRPVAFGMSDWVGGHYLDNQGQLWKKLLIRELFSDPDFLEVGL